MIAPIKDQITLNEIHQLGVDVDNAKEIEFNDEMGDGLIHYFVYHDETPRNVSHPTNVTHLKRQLDGSLTIVD